MIAGSYYRAPRSQVQAWTSQADDLAPRYDVLVAGGGLSGCAAAIAAARLGRSVLLIEPTHLLGGQMSVGGVGASDRTMHWVASIDTGLWGEFMERTKRLYAVEMDGKRTETNQYRDISFAANALVVDRVWSEMALEAGVEILRNAPVVSADISDTRAVLRTAEQSLVGKVAVDATEEGSLLDLANFPHRIGNAKITNGVASQPLSETAIQHVTRVAVVRRYDGGVPPELMMSTPPLNYVSHRDRWIKSRFPYRAGDYWGAKKLAGNFSGYRGLPDIASPISYTGLDYDLVSRTGLNYGNDTITMGDYLTDPAARHATDRTAIERTLAIIYYLQRELRLPWAVATDEGFAEGPEARRSGVDSSMPDWVKHFPISSYVRESRRLRGLRTMTQTDILRPTTGGPSTTWHPQCIALGSYMPDVHGQGDGELEADLGEHDIIKMSWVGGPFALRRASFIPADRRRLVAAEKNLSVSRIVSSAMRVHPSVTAIGQAAGVIAALSSAHDASPIDVPTPAVQVHLARQGAIMLPFPVADVEPGSRDHVLTTLACLYNRVNFVVSTPIRRVVLGAAELAAARVEGQRIINGVARWVS